ncbi:MAG: undecaprenyldiphospho-muramoylpentapeptide beta-N-acetylglucosaminyltransferase [Firmicutes bacterium]|nr:undecaprenyldiphospho-muramoylpentapeptide beta-N-acetylglucosaminyltransferase [Bacillota bacterium]
MFTGGGSAGHVTINLALIPLFLEDGWSVHYIGSQTGIEQQLVAAVPAVTYHAVATGKLRRYFSWKNASDPLRVVRGAWQTLRVLRDLRPNVVFSKGGFVSVPVVTAAWLSRIPVVLHESDLTPGLANRLCIPMATRVLTTFAETLAHLPDRRSICVGAVVRPDLFAGDAAAGRRLCGFDALRPVLMVSGGSLGSTELNRLLRGCLEDLRTDFQVVHICGSGQRLEELSGPGYCQFEFVTKELPDLIAAADIVVSRAGANALHEFLAVKKPMLVIPLPLSASRGDQIANAQAFAKRGLCEVLMQEEATPEVLAERIRRLYARRAVVRDRMQQAQVDGDAIERVRSEIVAVART